MSELKRTVPQPDGYAVARRLLGAVLATAVFNGCTSAHSALPAEAPMATSELYHLGPLRVLLRPQPEVEFICRLHSQQRATPNGRILGCYVPRERTIISTPDPHVLLHEFKHYFEGSFHD